MGLGLQGPLAVVILTDHASVEDRPGGWVRMADKTGAPVLGVHVLAGASDAMSNVAENHSVMWAQRYPADIVMVVEVLQ